MVDLEIHLFFLFLARISRISLSFFVVALRIQAPEFLVQTILRKRSILGVCCFCFSAFAVKHLTAQVVFLRILRLFAAASLLKWKRA